MITTHQPTLTPGQTFTTTGRQVLDPYLASAEVTEEINGAFTLQLSWPHNPEVTLAVGDIVAAPIPDGSRQGFRVATLSMDAQQSWHATCHHITFDLATNIIVDNAAVNMTGSEALAYLLRKLATTHPFTTGAISTLGHRDSVRWVRKSGLEALTGDDNGILTRWGGEITRDNTVLSWSARRGRITQVTVWEGKNLAGMDKTTDATALTTRILPVGFDGLTIPEIFVDSPRIGDYPAPMIRVERFEHIKAIKDPQRPGEDELPLPEAQQALREAAKARFSVDHVDVPALTCDVAMTPPEHVSGLEELRLGDSVTVRSATYAVDLTARVTAYTFNALSQSYISLTLTTANTTTPRGLAGQLRQISQSAVARAEETAAVIASANGSNRSYHQAAEPTGARLGDLWFQDDSSGKIAVWIYQATTTGEPGWVQLAGDITAAALEAELDAARAEVAQINTDLTGRIEKANADFQAGVDSVRADYQAADSATRETIAALDSEVTAAIEKAKTDLDAVDSATQQRADQLQSQLTAGFDTLRADYQAADSATRETIAALDSDITAAIDKARSDFTAADSALSDRVDSVNSELTGAITTVKAELTETTQATDARITAMDEAFTQADAELQAGLAGKVNRDGIIAEINASAETELIAGKRLHITGQARIDSAVITTAMIKDAAITNAKIGSIDAAKITSGYINAARIKAGSITSDKLLVANGFITSVMIKDAAITNAKIASLDASKITTGYLDAARIKAASIGSDKLVVADGFITTAMIKDAAITNAKIGALDAAKITTGYLDAARLKAGSITSDKLLVANGFITTAMIKDAAITSAKIASLDAAKITTGTLAAARIAAGSITSDKLSIAAGYITTAMIKDAAITSAKIGSLDAGKISTGTLNAARIGAGTITADKLATNAIQVGLAGWNSTIRITPYAISWYDGSTLEGQITSQGMTFWYGTRKIGWMGEQYKKGDTNVRGITNALDYQGDFVDWAYKASSTADSYTTLLTLDPKGKFRGSTGIHLGTDLRTHGWGFYTNGDRKITLQDCTLTNVGTYAGWASANGLAKVVFHTYDVVIVTNGSFYNMTRLFDRVKDLMSRVNSLITTFNKGWIKTIRDAGGGRITWEYYSNTGLATMSTNLT